jgi:hypothetical protein
MKRFAATLGMAIALVGMVRADDKPDPREKVDTAVAEAIRLMEAKDYAGLLKNFVPPDDLKKMTAVVTLDEAGKRFGEGKAPRLLKALKEAKSLKPTMDASGNKATFTFKESIDGKNDIVFAKIGKYWYIEK